jgi:hypothetical protein
VVSPFVRRKMALGFYRLDLGKDGLVSQEDLANLGQQVVERLHTARGSAEAAKIAEAFSRVWQAYGKPGDKTAIMPSRSTTSPKPMPPSSRLLTLEREALTSTPRCLPPSIATAMGNSTGGSMRLS